MTDREPLYGMAVAARLTRMHPQTLRKYERAGLLRPARSSGDQRLYSAADVKRLNRIRYLVEDRGLNVAGLDMTLRMVDRLDELGDAATLDDVRSGILEVIEMSDDAMSPRTSSEADAPHEP